MKPLANTELTDEILGDNLWRLMLRLSLPAIVGMSISAINNFLDAFFVGQFVGQAAVAAISLAFPILMINAAFSAMIGVGASSLLSRAIGAGQVEVQRQIFGTLLMLSLIVSLVLSVLGMVYARELIAFMGGRGEVLDLGEEYLWFMMAGSFFLIFALIANFSNLDEAKLREAMVHLSVSLLINAVLNAAFIWGLGWGVAGAAWATVISLGVFSLISFSYFFRGKASYPVDLRRFSLRPDLLKPILAIGVSAMMMQLMFFVQQAVVFKSLEHYGDTWDQAFMGASYRVLILVIFPAFGVAQALQPVVGINYGARNYARVRKAFAGRTLGGTALMTSMWIFIMIWPEQVLGLMLVDAVFRPVDIYNFRMLILTLPFFPVFFMGSTLFQAVGDAKMGAILTVSREVLLFVPAVLILPIFMGVNGIYFAGVPVNVLVLAGTLFMTWLLFRQWEARPQAVG